VCVSLCACVVFTREKEESEICRLQHSPPQVLLAVIFFLRQRSVESGVCVFVCVCGVCEKKEKDRVKFAAASICHRKRRLVYFIFYWRQRSVESGACVCLCVCVVCARKKRERKFAAASIRRRKRRLIFFFCIAEII